MRTGLGSRGVRRRRSGATGPPSSQVDLTAEGRARCQVLENPLSKDVVFGRIYLAASNPAQRLMLF